MLVDLFHWSLNQIDATDMESLIPFVFRYPRWKGKRNTDERRIYADQADFL